jgi:HPr serine kinase-like protein
MDPSPTVAAAIFDPFSYSLPLPLETLVYALGFPMRVVTNSEDIVTAVQESWSGFPQLFTDHALEMRIVVSDNERAKRPDGIVWRAQKHLMTVVSDAENFAVCDLARGLASFWLAPATARDREFFRRFYLNNVLELTLWHTHLTMIHAACVSRNGRGVLLCGESGAGKSCLSIACALRGWTFVTDDSSSLVRRSEKRMVVGGPRDVHFRDTALEILPELAGNLAPVYGAGKLALQMRSSAFPEIARAVHASVSAVVFLNRAAGGPARLVPMPAEEALARLDADLPLMETIEDQRASLRRVIEAGTFELRYGDLNEAVKVLESLV